MIVEPPSTTLPAVTSFHAARAMPDVVDAAVLVEAAVLDRDGRARQPLRHLRESRPARGCARRGSSRAASRHARRRTSSGRSRPGAACSGRSSARARRPAPSPTREQRRRRATIANVPRITPARRRRLMRSARFFFRPRWRRMKSRSSASGAGSRGPPSRGARRARRAGRSRRARPTPRRDPLAHEDRRLVACQVAHEHFFPFAPQRLERRRADPGLRHLDGHLGERRLAPDRGVADGIRGELLVRDDEPVVVAGADPGVGEADLLDDPLRALRSRPRPRAAAAG